MLFPRLALFWDCHHFSPSCRHVSPSVLRTIAFARSSPSSARNAFTSGTRTRAWIFACSSAETPMCSAPSFYQRHVTDPISRPAPKPRGLGFPFEAYRRATQQGRLYILESIHDDHRVETAAALTPDYRDDAPA